jgi:vacuolar-type H+-ATPase subunit C/Vma6
VASALRSYALAQARIRARIARMPGRHQVELLAEQRDALTLARELDFLGVPDSTAELLAEFDRVVALLEGVPRAVVAGYRDRYEVENLELLLRAAERGLAPHEIASLLLPVGALGSPALAASLLQSGSLAEVVAALPSEPFGDTLRRLLRSASAAPERFRLEAVAEREGWERAWRTLAALDAEDRRSAIRVLGAKCDAVNLVRLLRLRLHHQLAPEELVALAIRGGARLGAAERAALAHEEPALWAARLARTPYAPALSAWADPPAVERELARVVARIARAELAGTPFRIGLLLAYLVLLETQTADVRRVVEGVRLARPREWILRGLCGAHAS